MRRLTHINGLALATLWPGSTMEPLIKSISWESVAQPKDSLTDIPGADGSVQSMPYRDVRRFTIRGLVGGNPLADDEPIRVLKRIFHLGYSASDTITLGFTDNNFPGAGPHWTIAAMVSDELTFSQELQSLWRWQVILTAADPDFRGRSYTYTLSEGYAVTGHTYDYLHPFTYGEIAYVNTLTVFLEGSVPSRMSAGITGPATNPRITNLTTGESLQLNRTLTASDTIAVSETGIVTLNGQFRNSLRVVGTTMPRLLPGVNTLLFLDDTSPLVDGITGTLALSYTTRDA